MSEASAPAPPTEEVRSPLSDGEWHRMHPLTPLLRGGLFLLVVAGILVANLRERLIALFVPGLDEDVPGDPVDYLARNNLLLVAGAVLLGVLVVLLVVFWLSWRFHTFRITGDDVEVRSGVLFRTQRRAPLDRVQGVNLTRPLVARLFGMAKLEVVGAGSDANVKLEYLSTSHAETIRSDILRLASGRQLGARGTAPGAPVPGGGSRIQQAASVVGAGITGLIDGEDAEATEIESVVHIPPGRLAASRVLSGSTLALLAFLVVVIIGAVVGTPWVLLTFIPAVLGFGAYGIRSFVRALRYSIAPTPSGVRVTFGLLTTVSEILPPGRVHAVEVRQPLLWRPFGWWSITVTRISGRTMAEAGADQLTSVLPVGTQADVERVLRLLLPALPEEQLPHVFAQGILGPEADDPYATTPRRAWLLRPLSWRRNGVLLTPDALFLRRGFVWRALGILPLARMQSIGISQGPLDRALGLANLTAHVVPGTVTTAVGVLDRDDALRTYSATAESIITAAAGDRSHRWAQ